MDPVLVKLRERAAKRARLRALAAPVATPPAPELPPRERRVFGMLQTTGAASVDGGPSARIVPHPSVTGRAMNDLPHFTVEVTWQGKRSFPFATEPPMTIAEAQLAAGGLLLDPARWPGKRVKKINRLQAADLIEKALKKTGYTDIRHSFDPHLPTFTDVTIHAKDPAYRRERDPTYGHGTISIHAHDGHVSLDKTFAMYTDSTLRTRDVIDAALAGFEIDVVLDPPPMPKTELDPLDAWLEIHRAIDESKLDASDPARLYIGDLTGYRPPHAPRVLPLMRRDHERSRQDGHTVLQRHPIGRILVHGDDGRIEIEVEDEKDRALVQHYVDRAIQGRRVVPNKEP